MKLKIIIFQNETSVAKFHIQSFFYANPFSF